MSDSSEKTNDDVAEHLGRTLAHADELLAEWRDYSSKLRSNLDSQAKEAGVKAGEAMRHELARLGQGGALAGGGGRGPGRGPWIVVIVVQVVIGIVLAALVWSGRQPVPQAPVSAPADAAAIADASPPSDAPIDAAAKSLEPVCAGLLRGVASPSPTRLIRACAVIACGFVPPKKVDRGNRALRGALAKCQPERDGAVIEGLLQVLGSKAALGRCNVEATDDRSFAIDDRFVATCRGDSAK